MHHCAIIAVPALMFFSFGLSGCSHLAASNSSPLPANALGVVSVVSAEGRSTEIETTVSTPFRWNTLGRGAVRGMQTCTHISVQGGEAEFLGWLMCFPFGAMVGAVAGFASEPATAPPSVDDLEMFFADGRTQTLLQRYTSDVAALAGVELLVDKDRPALRPTTGSDIEPGLPTHAGADTQLEVWAKKVLVNVSSGARGVSVELAVDIHGRIVSMHNGQELRRFDMNLKSKPYSYSYWMASEYTPLHNFVKQAAEQLVTKAITTTTNTIVVERPQIY